MNKKDEERILTTLLFLNEKQRRVFLALEAEQIGRGGVAALSKLAGVSPNTIRAGKIDLESIRHNSHHGEAIKERKGIRSPGGGRKKVEEVDIGLEKELLSLLDSGGPLLYSAKGARGLAKQLTALGHPISHAKVASMLRDLEFDQNHSKTGPFSKDLLEERECSFQKINQTIKDYLSLSLPCLFLQIETFQRFKTDKDSGVKKTVYSNRKDASRRMVPTLEIGPQAKGIIMQWWEGYGQSIYSSANKILIVLSPHSKEFSMNLNSLKSAIEKQSYLKAEILVLPL